MQKNAYTVLGLVVRGLPYNIYSIKSVMRGQYTNEEIQIVEASPQPRLDEGEKVGERNDLPNFWVEG